MDGRSAASKHGTASNGRTTDEKLARDISHCGTGSQILRQVKCTVIQDEYAYHADQGKSAYLRKADMEKRDHEIVPSALHDTILIIGDTPVLYFNHGLMVF